MEVLLAALVILFSLSWCVSYYLTSCSAEPARGVIIKMVLTSKDVEIQPRVSAATGCCIICGLKDSHGWRCIGYFMKLSAQEYEKVTGMVMRVLDDVIEGKGVSVDRAKICKATLDMIPKVIQAVST